MSDDKSTDAAAPSPPKDLLGPGDAAPWFRAAALNSNPNYAFDTAAGRPILLLFFGTAAREESAAAIGEILSNRALFDDVHACFYGVTVDPADAAQGRIAQQIPGIRYFLDYDRQVSRLYGADAGGSGAYHPHWLLIDSMLRVVGRFPITQASAAIDALRRLAAEPPPSGTAPVLVVPNILEPELCRRLIALYEQSGGEESGFMRDVEGRTVLIKDPNHKRRRDCEIDDPALQRQLALRVRRRLGPMIRRAFQFEATRMERYLVGCYEAEPGGWFRPHRDDTTKGTAHRRFAVTINLNAGDYEGGDLRFPEFGRRTYRAPTGGAVVFSCSLLHEATPVTRGTRYAFLPFLYDEAAASLREENNPYLGESLTPYRRS